MWAWYYYHKTLALAPRAKHSITVPTVAYAIDMLQLLSEKQQKTQNTAQGMRKPEEKDPQKAYTNIKITLQEHQKKKSRKERRLQRTKKSKSGSRQGQRRKQQKRKKSNQDK